MRRGRIRGIATFVEHCGNIARVGAVLAHRLLLEHNNGVFCYIQAHLTSMSALLNNTKNLWRRSIKLKDSPYVQGIDPSVDAHPSQPVTFAVVGCGQRGKVKLAIFFQSLDI